MLPENLPPPESRDLRRLRQGHAAATPPVTVRATPPTHFIMPVGGHGQDGPDAEGSWWASGSSSFADRSGAARIKVVDGLIPRPGRPSTVDLDQGYAFSGSDDLAADGFIGTFGGCRSCHSSSKPQSRNAQPKAPP